MTDKPAIVSVLALRLSTQSYGGVGGQGRQCSRLQRNKPHHASCEKFIQPTLEKKRLRYALGDQHIQKRIVRSSNDNVRYHL